MVPHKADVHRSEIGTVKDMNRNRHNVPRDTSTRLIHSRAEPSVIHAWLRTLRDIRDVAEVGAPR
jgi:hypothetical protein